MAIVKRVLPLAAAMCAAAFVCPPAPGEAIPQGSQGLAGYIHMNVPPPPDGFGCGVSFYASAWPLIEHPLSDFQIGLPSTWIIPDNRGFEEPLCPVGTYARDHWPERGPSYRDVFQTIEGGLGFWASTRFGSATPKYRINGTPDGYSHEISSPGWGFGRTAALAPEQMGIAQLSNRLLVPPDGLTFRPGTFGQLFGTAWMALPLTPAVPRGADGAPPVGDQSWTLFVNAANFRGPVAFWIPEVWSRIARGYPTAEGRGLDTRPGVASGGAMEVNTVPMFVGADSRGTMYTRIPRLQFPVDAQGRTVLMQDLTFYSADALYLPVRKWLEGGAPASGRFARSASRVPRCAAGPISLLQGADGASISGIGAEVETAVFGASTFGLRWKNARRVGRFPEYFRHAGGRAVAIPEADVPAETRLREQSFARARAGVGYTSPGEPGTAWTSPGPGAGPFMAELSDGTVVTYAWYRFVDQPSVRALHLAPSDEHRLQSTVERIHAQWPVGGQFMPPPSQGALAALDRALIVRPPRGMERGWVPIVTRQGLGIEGWTAMISDDLWRRDADATQKALDLLRDHLRRVKRVVPAPALAALQRVVLWLSPQYPGVGPRAEYHPDAGWLRAHGRGADMARGIEFTNTRIFEAETKRMPDFVLHELAHAYHDQVLGFDNPEIEAAYRRSVAEHTYDAVRGSDGRVGRAYAITNAKEYFAESTEAFFGRNDFYPFTRADLARSDPAMARLLLCLWYLPARTPEYRRTLDAERAHEPARR